MKEYLNKRILCKVGELGAIKPAWVTEISPNGLYIFLYGTDKDALMGWFSINDVRILDVFPDKKAS